MKPEHLPSQFISLAIALFSCSSVAAPLPDSCVGNFCMFKPPTERQFVSRYGEGAFRRDDHDSELRYRCFNDGIQKLWVQFQFSRHGDREARHLEAIMLGDYELCAKRLRSKRSMNLKIAKGAVVIGMSAKEVTDKIGPPSRIMTLSPQAPNLIYDSRFGDHVWLYDTDEELLFNGLYLRDGKSVNYRLSFTE